MMSAVSFPLENPRMKIILRGGHLPRVLLEQIGHARVAGHQPHALALQGVLQIDEPELPGAVLPLVCLRRIEKIEKAMTRSQSEAEGQRWRSQSEVCRASGDALAVRAQSEAEGQRWRSQSEV